MIKFEDIRDVHLEISSMCNASCPWCPRTFWGYPYNSGYPEVNFTLANAQQVFAPEFLQQLITININGNFGDIVMNPEAPAIVDYFLSHNPNLQIIISTNGGARDAAFWTQLARPGVTVQFCIDGLADTHHLYRQNTVWATVIRNAETFIAAGGRAEWKMIEFDHNRHQIDQCRSMSQDLGFAEFRLVNEGRDTAPVFDRDGNLTHVLGNYTGEREFKVLFHKKKTEEFLFENILLDNKRQGKRPAKSVNCKAKERRSIYISATGDVSPCCWTGFYPKTYGAGQYHGAANSQLIPLIVTFGLSFNNALDMPLKDCLEWFNSIEASWKVDRYEQGRLVICDDTCGQW